ncbi:MULTISPECIES: molybdopterin cofactor-binding domain-containing protein [Comamonas]|uniref:xanthine dehydrogenase family protein molybdopterin-binding subunit n=1 Tax=Comamonas TaxID=283 RepID=UPI0015FC5489|nr:MULTISPECIES: molybdopterin cofactor-binding domain-containing protein [Comamonas]UUC93911.1 molybdopterin-dependent oxidoreductase [Comamonas sp. C11]WEE77961.1 molybdopterin-dependent oxidoreductase [Comamonas testosteroni]
MQALQVDRRDFLKAGGAAASLVLGFKLPIAAAKGQPARDPDDINAWLRIAPDGTVTIMVPSAEIGQGVYTSAPMLIAEELECDWRQVRAQIAPTDPVYANRMFKVQATASSTSSRWSFEPLRRIGAAARLMLVEAAAREWRVDAAGCTAVRGRVLHAASGRSLGYGELAPKAAQLPRPDVARIVLKARPEWRLIGQPVQRLDIPLKTNGSAVFGVDVKVGGMLIGTVAACPVRGGRLKPFDDKPALAVKGVHKVVPLAGSAVAVLGESYWPARQGLARLQLDWQLPEGPLVDSKAMLAQLRGAAAQTDTVAKRTGDPEAALREAAQRVEAEYEVPYLAHATLEPINATADVRADRAEIWGPTQVCGEIAERLAPHLGLPAERIAVHSTFVGGGFGRREEFDVFIQAALASQAARRPVKLIWSREEDIQQDFYRPAAAARFAAVLGEGGSVQALEARLACSSIYIRNFPDRVKNGVDPKSVEGVVDVPYALPHFGVRYAMVNSAIPAGFWRGVGYTQNCFFFESFIDELAHQARRNPLDFRLALLKDQPRHAGLLRRLASRAGWGQAPSPSGGDRHLGLALSEAWGSICGTAVELSVKDKRITIHRVVCVVDCGTVINPATVQRQLEGATIWGLAAAAFGEISIEQGKVLQSNFHDYPMLHLAQTPPIETELIESGAKIGGVGESGVPPLAPALANALFAATGERLRSLPLSRHGYTLA